MRKALGLSLVVLAVMNAPVPAVDQDRIDRAIAQGVRELQGMQNEDGTWPYQEIGMTALAGLTLLECGVPSDDKAIQRATTAVRLGCIRADRTYSISLSLLFLDRLGDPDDIPLIESLAVRLLAGQLSRGGWQYDCPVPNEAELRRLTTQVERRKELVGRRTLPRPGEARRTVNDLSPEIQAQLKRLEPVQQVDAWGDNSNTQFATLALWVARRHGLPVQAALERLATRFRQSQNADGGWPYMVSDPPPESTPSMTCAGLLGLAIGDGSILELAREKRAGRPPIDVNKDPHLRKGLMVLGSVIDHPRAAPAQNGLPEQIPQVGGNTYYFLWSLERIATALDLQTIGNKDWYSWGAEILLANQQSGGWHGDYQAGGADTCFALLFLKRSNLVRDLTNELKGKLTDPGEIVLRSGGVGGAALGGKPRKGMKSALQTKEGKPITKPLTGSAKNLPDSESGRLAGDLVKASGAQQDQFLDKLRDGKGTMYTQALALAIPQLEGEAQKKARLALAERLATKTARTLIAYLQDEDPEIRLAAARACRVKEDRALIPALIPLLRDGEGLVARAAYFSLKELTGQDFGPPADAGREERDQAAAKWLQWWNQQPNK
jgi:hypothetical protein